jgi:hypothetical protein
MAMPYVTQDRIVVYLRERAPQSPVIEVFETYPKDDSITPYGVYVKDVNTETREPYRLGVTYGGSIYTETDTFQVVFISFQGDPQSYQMREVIENMAANVVFFNGYHEVDFTKDIEIGNRSEKYTYSYSVKRLEFNNPVT